MPFAFCPNKPEPARGRHLPEEEGKRKKVVFPIPAIYVFMFYPGISQIPLGRNPLFHSTPLTSSLAPSLFLGGRCKCRDNRAIRNRRKKKGTRKKTTGGAAAVWAAGGEKKRVRRNVSAGANGEWYKMGRVIGGDLLIAGRA